MTGVWLSRKVGHTLTTLRKTHKMAEFPALPLFTDAYMADTRHLTTAQHGAYLLLLMTAWRMPDCRLPDDDYLLARWSGLDFRSWKKMRPFIIDQFWKKDSDGKLHQCRLLDERKHADTVRQKNAAAGRASALKRKGRHLTDVATKQQPDSNPLTLPTPTPIKDPPVSPKGGGRLTPTIFTGFSFEVDANRMRAWEKAYPMIDLNAEMAKAVVWLQANPKKAKSNYDKFLAGWFGRANPSKPKSSKPQAGAIVL